MVLLEHTAGQGRTLGHRFEHLARLLSDVAEPERYGVKDLQRYLTFGASPRASINLIEGARALGLEHDVKGIPDQQCSLLSRGNYVEYRIRSRHTTLYEAEGGDCIYDSATGVRVTVKSWPDAQALADGMDATAGVDLEDSRPAALLGELGGKVLATVALVLPGIGPIVAAGPLAAELGEIAGHVAGSLASKPVTFLPCSA